MNSNIRSAKWGPHLQWGCIYESYTLFSIDRGEWTAHLRRVDLQHQLGSHGCVLPGRVNNYTGKKIVINTYLILSILILLNSYEPSQLTVIVAQASLIQLDADEESINVFKIISHEAYNPVTKLNDIAMLQVTAFKRIPFFLIAYLSHNSTVGQAHHLWCQRRLPSLRRGRRSCWHTDYVCWMGRYFSK